MSVAPKLLSFLNKKIYIRKNNNKKTSNIFFFFFFFYQKSFHKILKSIHKIYIYLRANKTLTLLPLFILAMSFPCLSLLLLLTLALLCFCFSLFPIPALALPLFFLTLDLFPLLALLLLSVHSLQLSSAIVLFVNILPLEQGDVPPCQEKIILPC